MRFEATTPLCRFKITSARRLCVVTPVNTMLARASAKLERHGDGRWVTLMDGRPASFSCLLDPHPHGWIEYQYLS
jgi:hypothetical protein